MPRTPVEYVDQPLVMRRYTPDLTRLGALYARGGEQLADLALQRGQITAGAFDRLSGLWQGMRAQQQAEKQQAAALALRGRERAEDQAVAKAERDARAAERKAEKEAREAERADDKAVRAAEQSAARVVGAVGATRPGVVNPALYEQVKRLAPEMASRFQVQDGAPVLMRTPEQARQAEVDAATAAERTAQAEERKTDNLRADRQLAATIAAANNRTASDQKFVIRNGKVVPIAPGQALPGDVPYSAEAMQGMGGEASDVRSARAAAALNSIDKLKELAPKRSPGLPGMVEGAAATVQGALGYNTGARQYNALLQPTAMQMAVSIQGAAGLSNAEREAMAKMLGNIATMDYESQLALLENASQMIRSGADVALVDVKDPKTGKAVKVWSPMRSRMPGSVVVGGNVPGGGAVIMVAPNGQEQAVPADQVEHYKSLGAKVKG